VIYSRFARTLLSQTPAREMPSDSTNSSISATCPDLCRPRIHLRGTGPTNNGSAPSVCCVVRADTKGVIVESRQTAICGKAGCWVGTFDEECKPRLHPGLTGPGSLQLSPQEGVALEISLVDVGSVPQLWMRSTV
jgi:hypothetical protein